MLELQPFTLQEWQQLKKYTICNRSTNPRSGVVAQYLQPTNLPAERLKTVKNRQFQKIKLAGFFATKKCLHVYSECKLSAIERKQNPNFAAVKDTLAHEPKEN